MPTGHSSSQVPTSTSRQTAVWLSAIFNFLIFAFNQDSPFQVKVRHLMRDCHSMQYPNTSLRKYLMADTLTMPSTKASSIKNTITVNYCASSLLRSGRSYFPSGRISFLCDSDPVSGFPSFSRLPDFWFLLRFVTEVLSLALGESLRLVGSRHRPIQGLFVWLSS